MKYSATALLLSLAAPAARADVVILDKVLNSAYSVFDPMEKAEMVGEEACERVSGDAIHAHLPYVTGVSVECVPGSAGCDALHPPFYGGTDRWLVTSIVVPFKHGDEDAGAVSVRGANSKAGKGQKSGNSWRCPGFDETPDPIKNSLEVSFYKQDERQHGSLPHSFARMDEEGGGTQEKYGVYTVCMKVPIDCKNTGQSFPGWTGISYQNRPLVPEDCEGDLDFYIDSIKVASRCPFNTGDNTDYDTSFCRDVSRSGGDDGDDYRGVCEDEPAGPFASALVTE